MNDPDGPDPRADEQDPERSAGGVVLRGEDVAVIVPHKRDASGNRVLGLPKGHVDGDETPQEAAAREVREEAGITGRLIESLGDVRYTYRRAGRTVAKQVMFFLFEYLDGDPADHDHEIEEARWMPLREAVHALTYDGERRIAARALSLRDAER